MINNKKVEREVMLQLQHVRLKCLKLAVQSSDTEAELNVLGILARAQLLVDYVINGTVPVMATGDETVAPGQFSGGETVTPGDGI
jgi:hypothetical protein